MPSVSPSSAPTIIPTCPIDEFLGKDYYSTFETPFFCFKIELQIGGSLLFDQTNPGCSNPSFTPTSQLSVLDSVAGNVATFVPGDLGFQGVLSF